METFSLLDIRNLTISAAIGFLIGFEREWTETREGDEASFAGARTFTLVAFIGAISGLVTPSLIFQSVVFGSVGILTAIAYWSEAQKKPASGGTTEIALLTTFLLGLAVIRGHVLLASAAGVFVALLLSMKHYTAFLASKLTEIELRATLRFLVISIIILPIAPNQGFGPYGAINPREIWLMVVFISGLSFSGYWLMKLFDRRRAVLLTGIIGGLASSTATTISVSRMVRAGDVSARMGAAGVLLANAMMVLRVGLIVAVIAWPVFEQMWPVLAITAALMCAIALALSYRFAAGYTEPNDLIIRNPLELTPALIFAGLLGLVTLAAAYGSDRFGDGALYLLAIISGGVDIDAVTLAASRNAVIAMIEEDTAIGVICLAISVNAIAKALFASFIGGTEFSRLIFLALIIVLVVGLGVLALTVL